MNNPFEILEQRLISVEEKIDNLISRLENPETATPTWISTKQLADNLGVSTAMINKLRGSKLPYYKLGGKIFFKKEEVDEWLEKSRHKSGSEYLNEHLGLR